MILPWPATERLHMRVVEPFDFRAREKSTCRSGQLWKIIRQIVCLTSQRGLCIFRILRPIYPKLVIVTSQYGSRFRVFCLLYLPPTLTHCLSALGAHFTQARALIAGKLMLVRSVDAELDRKIFHSMTLKTRLKPGVISYSRNETENKKIVDEFLTVFNSIFLELTNLILFSMEIWSFREFVVLLSSTFDIIYLSPQRFPTFRAHTWSHSHKSCHSDSTIARLSLFLCSRVNSKASEFDHHHWIIDRSFDIGNGKCV